MENSKNRKYHVRFVTARETVNIALAERVGRENC